MDFECLFNAKRCFIAINGEIHYVDRISIVNMQTETFTARIWGAGVYNKTLAVNGLQILGVLEDPKSMYLSGK